MHGLQADAAQGLHGLQAPQADFLAAHGLHGLQAEAFLAAQGLHGLQAPQADFLAAHGLQGLQAEAFLAAQGLHGLQAPQADFLAAHGLHGLQADTFFAAHGFAVHAATLGVATPAESMNAAPAAPPRASGIIATVVNNFDLNVAMKSSVLRA